MFVLLRLFLVCVCKESRVGKFVFLFLLWFWILILREEFVEVLEMVCLFLWCLLNILFIGIDLVLMGVLLVCLWVGERLLFFGDRKLSLGCLLMVFNEIGMCFMFDKVFFLFLNLLF